MKMSLYDINYEYKLFLKYTFMKILYCYYMIKRIGKTKSVIFEKILLQTWSVETLKEIKTDQQQFLAL